MKGISQKHKAWILWKAGHRTPGALKRKADIPERSGQRYIADFKSGGSWERNAYSPRAQKKTAPKIARKVIQKSRCRTRIYSTRQIGASVGVSHVTVQKILKSRGINFKSHNRRLPLTKERRTKRLRFARFMQKRKREWSSTIITDEASFWLNKSKPDKVWTSNAEEEVGRGVHGPKVHCWGGISARGALKLELFEENLNAKDYLKIISRKVPEINRLYPDGWQWQQDGSGVHRAVIVKKFLETKMPQKMDWPPYSPDLSPIENVWGWLKGKVSKDVPKNVNELKRSIKKHWDSMDIEFLAPYFDSMPKRMAMVIENEGRKIKY